MTVDPANTRMEREVIRNRMSGLMGLSPGDLTERKRLFHDLNIYGDEAVRLLTEFEERKGVDWSTMTFLQYFPEEGPFVLLFARCFKSYRAKFREFTVGHFIDCVLAGKWYPVEPSDGSARAVGSSHSG